MPEHVIVTSEDGLYDRKRECAVYDINDRGFCLFRHNWIDAALHVRKPVTRPFDETRYYGGDLIEHNWQKPERMKTLGTDPIRFCKSCKLIDCVHYCEYTTYEIKHSAFYSHIFTVGNCLRCEAKILLRGFTSCHPSQIASEIISEVAAEVGTDLDRWGSAVKVELPVQVSAIAERSETEAREYVRSVLRSGSVPAGF